MLISYPERQIHSQFALQTVTVKLMSRFLAHWCFRKKEKDLVFRQGLGSPNWARTSDIMINSHALCRLSYRGMLGNVYVH